MNTKNQKRYLLIVNPAGGSGRTMNALPEIEKLLRERGVEYAFHFTYEPLHAVELVKELASEFDVVVSVGGDGTINEILNGLPDFDLPLGMIPIGTGNDFARSCVVPYDDLEKAVEILLNHDVRNLDVGEVNGRRFINVLGMGFEGRSNDIGRVLTFIKGSFKYILAIAYTLVTYRRIPMTISINGEAPIKADTFLISVGNGWNVGGGLQLTPKARLDDGHFDISYIRKISRWRIIANFYRLLNGTIDELHEIQSFQATELVVDSPVSIPLHLDGEVLNDERKHLEIKLYPQEQPVIGNWSADPREHAV